MRGPSLPIPSTVNIGAKLDSLVGLSRVGWPFAGVRRNAATQERQVTMQGTTEQRGAKAPLGFPVLPLRDIVVFPHKIVPLFVGREKSVRALEDVGVDEKQILLVTQKNPALDDPGEDDLYMIGTLA